MMEKSQQALCKWIRGILLFVSVGLLAAAGFGWQNFEKINKEYRRTTARIESIERHYDSSAGKKRVYLRAIASYEVEGKQYREKLNFYSSMMKVGEDINILYNPRDPLQLRSLDFEPFVYLALFIGGLMLLVSAFVFPRLMRKVFLKNSFKR